METQWTRCDIMKKATVLFRFRLIHCTVRMLVDIFQKTGCPNSPNKLCILPRSKHYKSGLKHMLFTINGAVLLYISVHSLIYRSEEGRHILFWGGAVFLAIRNAPYPKKWNIVKTDEKIKCHLHLLAVPLIYLNLPFFQNSIVQWCVADDFAGAPSHLFIKVSGEHLPTPSRRLTCSIPADSPRCIRMVCLLSCHLRLSLLLPLASHLSPHFPFLTAAI